MLLARELTQRVIGLAIEVHRLTGPGMLESVYEGCLCHPARARCPSPDLPPHERAAARSAVQFSCATVEGRPTAICRLKPLRAAPWSPC